MPINPMCHRMIMPLERTVYFVNGCSLFCYIIKQRDVLEGFVLAFVADLAEGLAKQLDVIEIKRCLRVRKLVDREIHVWMLFFGR